MKERERASTNHCSIRSGSVRVHIMYRCTVCIANTCASRIRSMCLGYSLSHTVEEADTYMCIWDQFWEREYGKQQQCENDESCP